ncbi:immunity 49 family protein [Streptomyces sp. TS71-3]|uniref:immunity 49 family protein n=1 Tax=Streptomyces sp. TS71-3 TaxID=2733862 RepID=UPI001B1AD7E9|nr:immunity 49 family protein [Streptomyces sp. TS71-3]GHJ37078.1 hypothetical protein Sm713_26870 [Streptomyces sp. TS71-3]
MPEVTCHEVGERYLARALEDITGRTYRGWHWMRYADASPEKLDEIRDDLLDHVAARAAQDPALRPSARTALRTAAECSLGTLSLGCFPKGDQEIPFPLIDESLSSRSIAFGDIVELAPTARTWCDGFAVCLVSGVLGEWRRGVGLLLRDDYAPAIRDGLPDSKQNSVSDPADLAAMEALCGYLAPSRGHLPRDRPTAPLRKPDGEQRAEAARRLDAEAALTPDQRLLRVLLDDDRHAFEQALVARLVEHRESVGPDPAPRTLLPVGALALAALAVQVHGWEPGVRSGYLPASLLGSPAGPRPAARADGDGRA